ncbi:unnamed protein product [Schistosoma curassoni]|uniref:Uncharacterized protein n=1 Tax=Schistosoma curassoni TaxID=6186 RepID=A0A183JFH9_9TREM|nr:unnamed protein product [Schistosoma curassoni]
MLQLALFLHQVITLRHQQHLVTQIMIYQLLVLLFVHILS